MDNIYNDPIVKELIKKDFIIDNKSINLNKSLTNGLNGILVIYSPQCENCLMSKEMWENLANLFKYKFNIFALNGYNFDDNNHLLTLPLNVSSYPDYKFIDKNGHIHEYKGSLRESEITKFIIKNID